MSKSRFDARKAAQGYKSLDARSGCRNCTHGAEITGRVRRSPWEPMDCRLGAFWVSPFGICNHFKPGRPAAAEARPANPARSAVFGPGPAQGGTP